MIIIIYVYQLARLNLGQIYVMNHGNRNVNSAPLALRHNFMYLDDPVGTATTSDKSAKFNMA